jgi:hypothetical protein
MAKPPPLVFEHLQDELNMTFLTLIEYKKVKYLTIVENVIDEEIHAYVLDQLEAEGIDQQWFMSVATRWFYGASDRYPLSFEFTKFGQGDVVRKALKTFNMNSASRVIGKLFVFNMNGKPKVRRRKVQPLPAMLEVKLKGSTDKPPQKLGEHTQELPNRAEKHAQVVGDGS